MGKKIILGGLLGGVVLFVWQSVSHLVLPLGEVGVGRLGNEGAVIAALRESVQQPGLYLFPAAEIRPGMSGGEKQAAMNAAMEKYRTGPNGLLVYHPRGSDALSPRQLLLQLGADIAAMLVAAWVVRGSAPAGFGARALLVALLGLLPTLTVNFSYWNWYGFPADYTLAQLADHVIGFLAAGLVIAALVRPRAQHAGAAV